MAVTPTPKIRSRKDGAAAPLDDVDRKVLNLMQGKFPLEPKPFAAVARLADLSEAEVMARVQRLLDVQEGADVVMVKPALAYLDVIRRVKDATKLPVAAYNVSGEYAMIKSASAAGLLDERAAVLEALTGIRRAGADIVITYHAKDAARWL